MNLREEIRWKPVDVNWFLDENQNKTGEHLTYESIDEIINKVLDAAVEAQGMAAAELGIDEQAQHYLKEAINKMRGG